MRTNGRTLDLAKALGVAGVAGAGVVGVALAPAWVGFPVAVVAALSWCRWIENHPGA